MIHDGPAGALAPPGAQRRPARPVPGIAEAVLPGLLFLGGQAVAVATVAAVAVARHRPTWSWLHVWDGAIFLRIARLGYAGLLHGHRSPYAFFPGYPLSLDVARVVTALPPAAAAEVVSVAGGVAVAYGLRALVIQLGGSRRQWSVLIVLAATGPLSVVLAMAYSEALFTALSTWTLVLVLRRAWKPAAVLCAVAGLVRITGVALVAAMLVALAAEVLGSGAGLRTRLGTTRRLAGPALVAPLGVVSYLAVVGWRTGRPLGWFALQSRGWGTHLDAGHSTLTHVAAALSHPAWNPSLAPAALALAAAAMFAGLVATRRPWPLVVFAACVLAMDYASAGYWDSRVRLLLPAVPLLLPVARLLARGLRAPLRRHGVAVAALLVLAVWVVAGVAYSAWAVDVWPHAL